MRNKTLWILNWILMLLPLAMTVLMLPHLPDQIPAHYGFDGQVDRWGSKYETLIFPVLSLVTGAILLPAAWYLGKKEGEKQNNQRLTLIAGAVSLAVFCVMTGYFLYTDLAQVENLSLVKLELNQLIFGLLGVAMILLGNGMPKLRRNSIIGLRTSWSQSSEEAWKRSQKFGGMAMILAGVGIVALCLLTRGVACFVGSIAMLLTACGVSVWYSYRVAKDLEGKPGEPPAGDS